MRVWTTERAVDLVTLLAAAMPGEELSEDELLASCWDDLDGGDAVGVGAVLGTDDGTGAVAVAVRPATGDRGPTAFVQVVVARPDAHRAGLGHELLAAAEAWAWDHGADELRLEGAPPFYLWPGVDDRATAMHALAASRGYEQVGTAVNMALPSTFRAAAPDGIAVRRVIGDGDRAAVRSLIDRHWPAWWPEAERAIEHGCCHGAFAGGAGPGADPGPAGDRGAGRPGDGGVHEGDAGVVAEDVEAEDGVPADQAVGFVCHSVSRAGWLGPMGTDPGQRGRGIGVALIGEVCRDLMIAEMPEVEICWAGPQDFYAAAGARISRTFRRYRLARPTR